MEKNKNTKPFNISPLVLIVSGNNQKYNVMSATSVGLLTSSPDLYVISIKKDRYTTELIEGNGEFTVNIPFSNLLDKADYCGIVSGTNRNKIDDVNFSMIKSEIVSPPIIADCAINFECKVYEKYDIGEWIMFLGEIKQQYVNTELLDEKNNFLISGYNPILYSTQHESYFNLSEKIGSPGIPSKSILQNL